MEGDINSSGGRQTMSIRTLPPHDKFEVLYPTLYYIYTDRVCFTTAPIQNASTLYNVPPCDPESAYRLGDLLGLDQLKSSALAFLLETTDETNIISRIFGEPAL